MCWWCYLSLTLSFLFLLPFFFISLSLFFLSFFLCLVLSFFLSLVQPSSTATSQWPRRGKPRDHDRRCWFSPVPSPPSKREPRNTKTMIAGAGFWFCRRDFVTCAGFYFYFDDWVLILSMVNKWVLLMVDGFCWWVLFLFWWMCFDFVDGW